MDALSWRHDRGCINMDALSWRHDRGCINMDALSWTHDRGRTSMDARAWTHATEHRPPVRHGASRRETHSMRIKYGVPLEMMCVVWHDMSASRTTQ
eukprot:351133-Chlamydomonas_euryale.AAC.15